MQFTPSDILQSVTNYISSRENDGYRSFFRFSERQLTHHADSPLSRSMSLCPSGVCLNCETNGDEISLQVRALKVLMGPRGTSAAKAAAEQKALSDLSEHMQQSGISADLQQHFDLWLDGQPQASLNLKNERLRFSFANPTHAWREVKIWFPLYSPIEIGSVSASGEIRPLTHLPTRRLYCFGDSITQGYLVNSPSHAYAQALAHTLDARLLNQGLAGGVFDPAALPARDELPEPDLLTICFGTNDWFLDFSLDAIAHNASACLERLRELYPAAPIFVITPFWRGDMHERRAAGTLTDVITRIAALSAARENVHLIDGVSISPPTTQYYGDGFLHPNSRGHDFITPLIYKQIKRVLD